MNKREEKKALLNKQKEILKKAGIISKKIAPYLLVGGLTIYGAKLGGLGLPFWKDEIKKEGYNVDTLDSFNNYHKETLGISPFPFLNEDRISTYTVYEECQKSAYSKYQRRVKVYDISGLEKKDVEELLRSPFLQLDEILGEPLSDTVITQDSFLHLEKYYEAKIYLEGEEKYLEILETDYENFINTFLILVALLSFESTLYFVRIMLNSENIPDSIRNLFISEDNLKRELQK